MVKKKSIQKHDIPEIKKEIVEDKIEEKVVENVSEKKYVLTQDINLSLKKGMEVSKEQYDKLVGNGLGWCFE